MTIDGAAGEALWRRTEKVVPGGGIYFTRSARFAGRDVLPGFIESADGCRVTDAAGKTYLDFNCGNGPNLLGYRHPEVEAAAQAQSQQMDLAPFFPTNMPDYAERLLAWGEGFDWTIFTKNGSDSTNLAMRIMRVATQRPYVVLFQAAYHGFGAEIALTADDAPVEQQRYVIRVPWNDVAKVEEVLHSHGDQVAGLMVNPLDQSPASATQSVSAAMVDAIDRFRSQSGALLALDDVRNGFRLHAEGSHRAMGLEPDLLCLGKALANGYATSAILGKQAERAAAETIGFTATYMFSSVAYAAGIATLDVYERENVFEHMQAMGQKLVDGILQAARKCGHDDLILSGPSTMPTLLFQNDRKAKRAKVFAGHAARLGAIFHPRLNWFLSYAHKPSDIEEAIAIARDALAATPVDEASI